MAQQRRWTVPTQAGCATAHAGVCLELVPPANNWLLTALHMF